MSKKVTHKTKHSVPEWGILQPKMVALLETQRPDQSFYLGGQKLLKYYVTGLLEITEKGFSTAGGQ